MRLEEEFREKLSHPYDVALKCVPESRASKVAVVFGEDRRAVAELLHEVVDRYAGQPWELERAVRQFAFALQRKV